MNRPVKASSSSNYSFWPTKASVQSPSSSSSSTDSLSPATKKQPIARSKIPYKIFYPMKSQYESGSMEGDSTDQFDDIDPRTEWIGLTPLDMVQNIVSLAQKSPEFSAGLRGSLRNFLTSDIKCPGESS
mmetsp:Transcript_33070/g.69416  ORF Transcript_33070/g.69416 Transcript_33070/m.69416 type:complete len:129 (-) Transcript_33070:1281-1667(-)